MSTRFCENCGASRLPDARFCVECGESLTGGVVSVARRPVVFARYAPLLVIAAIALAGGTAVWVGTWSAKPPAFVPPRDTAPRDLSPGDVGGGGELPAGHPQVSLPDDVRQRIEQMAKEAAAKPTDVKLWNQLGLV